MLGYPNNFYVTDNTGTYAYSGFTPIHLAGGAVAIFAIQVPNNFVDGDTLNVVVGTAGDGLNWSTLAPPVVIGTITAPKALTVTYANGEFLVTDGITAYVSRNILDPSGWTSIPVVITP